MVDADEETALLPARDAAGREEPSRRRGHVVAFVLVIGGVLAFVAAAGRGAAEDGAPFQITGQPTQAPPHPRPPMLYYHKGPPARAKDESSPDDPDDSHHDDDEDDDKPCDEA